MTAFAFSATHREIAPSGHVRSVYGHVRAFASEADRDDFVTRDMKAKKIGARDPYAPVSREDLELPPYWKHPRDLDALAERATAAASDGVGGIECGGFQERT